MTEIPRPSADALLDQPPLSPAEVSALEQALGALLGTDNDIVLVQSEAIVALEAVAHSVAGPGIPALNVVTGPYGDGFGQWMRQAGSPVRDLVSPFDEVARVDDVVAAIRRDRPRVVSLVHAEAATGGTNDVAPILRAAREVGAVTVLDAVASIGAEPVLVAEWDIDLTVIGGQKGLAGPAGVSAVVVSPHAWAHIDANPGAPRSSVLSVLDWRDAWLRTDRSVIPGLPSWLESRALALAVERVRAEGLATVNARHAAAAAATRAGVHALGLELWQRGAGVAPVATAVRIPLGRREALQDGALGGILSAGVGVLKGQLLRVNHYGQAARPEPVNDALVRIAAAMSVNPGAALEAAAKIWGASGLPEN